MTVFSKIVQKCFVFCIINIGFQFAKARVTGHGGFRICWGKDFHLPCRL